MQNPKSPPPIFCMVLLLSHVWILIVFFFQHLFRMKNIDNTNTRSTPSKYLNISPHPSCRSFQPVPNGEKGESTEKAERASELGHKRGPGVDQHLRLDESVVGQGVQAEQEVLGLVSCRMSVANNFILQVLARFEAASLLVNPIQVLHKNLVVELLVSPGLCWNHMVMNFKKYFCPTFQYQNIGKRCGNWGH